jgi:hypothetical protein
MSLLDVAAMIEDACTYPIQEEGKHMSAADIANRHLTAALSDAKAEGVDTDALCRSRCKVIRCDRGRE